MNYGNFLIIELKLSEISMEIHVFFNADLCGEMSIVDVPKHDMDIAFETGQFTNHEWSTIVTTVNHSVDVYLLKELDSELKVINTVVAIADYAYLHDFFPLFLSC
jgi:hypothetical protein